MSDVRKRILGDPFLRFFYEKTFDGIRDLLASGDRNFEVGSGSGVAEIFLPQLTCTEVEPNEFVEIEVHGSELPWAPSSVDNLVLVNAFHHLPHPSKFLSEASRCLRVGGRIILVEPFWAPLAATVYYLLHPEPFNPFVRSWDSGQEDPWDSNQALSWVVFRRDKDLLKETFPNLKVRGIVPFSGLSYLLSGGVFHRTSLPSNALISLAKWEHKQKKWLWPLRMFSFIWLEKCREN